MGKVGEREGGMNWESSMETYTTICKTDSQWEFAVWSKKVKPSALWQPRGVGWGGKVGREVQEGEGICIPMADSCWYMAETNIML